MKKTAPDLWDRILARLDRQEEARAQLRSDVDARIARKARSATAPKATAKARWNTAIAKARAENPSRNAVSYVNAQHPGLRLKMLAEVNSQ